MAVPKRRVSNSKSAKRRTHYKVILARPSKDKSGSWKMSHRIGKDGEY
jgi:large subunit ribosomal protein L32